MIAQEGVGGLIEDAWKEDKVGTSVTTIDNKLSFEEFSVDERMKRKGIPNAKVLENLDDYFRENNLTSSEAGDKARDDLRRYKLIEASFSQQRARIQENLLDYKKSLAALEILQEQKAKGSSSSPMNVTYKLDENIYSRAVIDNVDKVCIWLGANIMVEYELDEGEKLLKSNLTGMENLDKEIGEELDFLRDQITTTEVNVAFLHNYNMKKSKEVEKLK